MGEAMTSKTTAEHDDTRPGDAELDGTFYAVSDVESIAKAVIRAAPARTHRWLMWDAYQSAMEGAAESSAEMPWDPPEAVTRVTARSARHALIKTLEAIPDIAERDRLAKVAAREAEKVEQRMESGIPDSDVLAVPVSVLACQWCSAPIPLARGPKARYCRNSHRVSAHRAKKRAAERANATAPAAR